MKKPGGDFVSNALLLSGVAFVVAGLCLIYQPLALLAVGVGAIYAGLRVPE
jgi:hypothetical protein